MEVSGQLYTPAALSQDEKAPNIQRIGGWVGQRASPDTAVGKRSQFTAPTGNWTPILQSVT